MEIIALYQKHSENEKLQHSCTGPKPYQLCQDWAYSAKQTPKS